MNDALIYDREQVLKGNKSPDVFKDERFKKSIVTINFFFPSTTPFAHKVYNRRAFVPSGVSGIGLGKKKWMKKKGNLPRRRWNDKENSGY